METAVPTALWKVDSETLGALREVAGHPGKAQAVVERLRWPHGITCPSCTSAATRPIQTVRSGDRGLHVCDDCDRQFTWRVGTVFRKSPNRPEHLVRALTELAGGGTAAAASSALVEEHGFSRARARKLVEQLEVMVEWPAPLETVAPTPAAAPIFVNVQRQELQVQMVEAPTHVEVLPVSVPVESQTVTRRAAVAVAASVVAVACVVWLAVGGSQQRGLDEPRQTSWIHNGEVQRWSTTREPHESFDDWVKRHEREVETLQARYSPDR